MRNIMGEKDGKELDNYFSVLSFLRFCLSSTDSCSYWNIHFLEILTISLIFSFLLANKTRNYMI